MVDVLVAVPWRDRGNEHAQESLDFVIEHLYSIFGVTIHLVDAPTDAWSLSAARNAAVDRARREGCDVVFICDADTVVDPDAAQAAVELAAECGRVVLPFTLYRALGPASSTAVKGGVDPRAVPIDGELDWSVGGVFAVSPDVWDRAGRQDERFTGWGCEDTAFAIASSMLVGDHLRVPGIIHHLWHPVTWREEDESTVANAHLLQRYSAVTSPEEMAELVREWR